MSFGPKNAGLGTLVFCMLFLEHVLLNLGFWWLLFGSRITTSSPAGGFLAFVAFRWFFGVFLVALYGLGSPHPQHHQFLSRKCFLMYVCMYVGR